MSHQSVARPAIPVLKGRPTVLPSRKSRQLLNQMPSVDRIGMLSSEGRRVTVRITHMDDRHARLELQQSGILSGPLELTLPSLWTKTDVAVVSREDPVLIVSFARPLRR